MLDLSFNFSAGDKVLCLGAHCDDIEIGCGGTLVELRRRYPQVTFHWVIFSGEDNREAESRAAAANLLGEGPHCTVEVKQFRGSYFPYCAADIKDEFEKLKRRVSPQLVFTHHLPDRHQDHRVIAEMTWNTFRNHAILEYEIPKYEGDLGHPNAFVAIAQTSVDLKLKTLMECFPSQHSRTWFDTDLFRGHMRLRGVECNSPSRFAEAFHARKLLL